MVKNTPTFLNKIEDIFSEAGYVLRYEKGNFKAGYCLLKDTKVVIINKYFNTENRIYCLIDLLKGLEIDTKQLSEKSQKLLNKIFD